jgi:hypothetical protein
MNTLIGLPFPGHTARRVLVRPSLTAQIVTALVAVGGVVTCGVLAMLAGG